MLDGQGRADHRRRIRAGTSGVGAVRRARRVDRGGRHQRRGRGRDGRRWSRRSGRRPSRSTPTCRCATTATGWSPSARPRSGRLDVLYNNAAVQMSGRLVECTEDDWDRTIATNLNAVFWACRAALPVMLEGDGGSIISTASVLGLIGSEGYVAYGAAKAGLVALTRQIAVEYGPTVRANVIAPGSIDTPRFRKVAEAMDDPEAFLSGLARVIPLQRLGTADDVAGIALFLASDQSAYVSRRDHPRRRRPGGAAMSVGERVESRRSHRHRRGVRARRGGRRSSCATTATTSSAPTSTRPSRGSSSATCRSDADVQRVVEAAAAQGSVAGDGPQRRGRDAVAGRRLHRRRLAARHRHQLEGPVPVHAPRGAARWSPPAAARSSRMGSTLGSIVAPQYPAYCASKFGLTNLCKQVAIEHAGDGVRVNVLSLGPTDTGLVRAADRHGARSRSRCVPASPPTCRCSRLGRADGGVRGGVVPRVRRRPRSRAARCSRSTAGSRRGGCEMTVQGFRVLDADAHVVEPPDVFSAWTDNPLPGRPPRRHAARAVRRLRPRGRPVRARLRRGVVRAGHGRAGHRRRRAVPVDRAVRAVPAALTAGRVGRRVPVVQRLDRGVLRRTSRRA